MPHVDPSMGVMVALTSSQRRRSPTVMARLALKVEDGNGAGSSDLKSDVPSPAAPLLPSVGQSGVPNKLMVASLDPDVAAPALSTEAALMVETKDEVPYRMAIHPCGDGVVCTFPIGSRVVNGNSGTICRSLLTAIMNSCCKQLNVEEAEKIGLDYMDVANLES